MTREPTSRMKAQAVAIGREHAIDHERLDVDLQVQRAAEALNDGDGPAPTVGYASVPRAATGKPEDRPDVHVHHRATQIVIPREHIPEPVRQAQGPLTGASDHDNAEPRHGAGLPLVRPEDSQG